MKTFKLFKRDSNGDPMSPAAPGWRERHWHVRFYYKGRVYPRTLETTDAKEAMQRARALYAAISTAILKEKYADLAGTRSRAPRCSTLGEIIMAYTRLARIKSAAANIGSLRSLIRHALGKTRDELADDAIDRMPASILTRAIVRDYQDAVVPAAAPMDDAKRTAITTANSTVRQARSLFKRELVEEGLYKEAGIHLPDLTGFRAQKLFKEPPHFFTPLPAALIAGIWTASRDLREANPNAYRAFLLSVCCGLRRGETARARWGDVHHLEGDRRVLKVGIAKNGQPRLVPMEAGLYDELRALAPVLPMQQPADVGEHSDHSAVDTLLTGPYTVRYRVAFDDLSAWLKSLGWTRTKKAHELRKHFGSIAAQQHGTRIGSMLLGNTEPVFRAHYDGQSDLPEVKMLRG